MKKKCPSCHRMALRWKLFKRSEHMICQACDRVFRFSGRLLILIQIMALSPMHASLFFGVPYETSLKFIPLVLILVIVATQFAPAKLVPESERHLLPRGSLTHPSQVYPYNVEFEKTNDVGENIKRFKEAQRIMFEQL